MWERHPEERCAPKEKETLPLTGRSGKRRRPAWRELSQALRPG